MKIMEITHQHQSNILQEIDMSPGNLKQLASEIDARVGMEFEMIVPDIENDDSDEYEPDFSRDERVRDIGSIQEFFDDHDHNSPRSIRRIQEVLFEEYIESDYIQQADEYWWNENEEYYVGQEVEKKLGEELWQQASEQLGDRKFANERDRKNAITEIYNRLVEDRTEESIKNTDKIYTQAREDGMDEAEPDHDRFFERYLRNEYRFMSDVHDAHGDILNWPHYEQVDSRDSDISSVANDFSAYVNMKVDYSTSYHGAKRKPDRYVVEPDSSLSGDNRNDTGLEFVSPPLTLAQMTEHLAAVKQYAKDKDCYTNDSTGLHINVSVPGMSMDNLDYVKLALLLGDKYVLEQFGRSANTYCRSAMDEILSRAKASRDQVPGLLDAMKAGLNKLASKMIHSGSTAKYISINNKNNYIEFRSPGGDWLNSDLDTIVSTMNRFVVALDAAVDPAKYKEEYSKKLYKVIAPEDANDTIKYFAKYASGSMPKAALKSFLKQARLEREVNRKPDDGKLYYWSVTVPGSSAGLQVIAANRTDAWAKATSDQGYPEWGSRFSAAAATIRVVKPYTGDQTPSTQQPASDSDTLSSGSNLWQIINNDTGQVAYEFYLRRENNQEDANQVALRWTRNNGNPNFTYSVRQSRTQQSAPSAQLPLRQDGSMTAPESDPDANFAIIRNTDNAVITYLTRNTRQEAERSFDQWLRLQGADLTQHPYYLIAVRPRSSQDSEASGRGFTGTWSIQDPSGRVIHRFFSGWVQSDANRYATNWLGQNPEHIQSNLEVVPEMT